MVVSFPRPLGDEPVFHPLARPGSFAQEGEAGLHRWIELETANGDAPPHFAPAMPLDQLVDDVFQRDAVQRIVGVNDRRCHVKVLLEELSKMAGSKASNLAQLVFALTTANAMASLLNGVNTPWRTNCGPAYSPFMKHDHFSQDQNPKPASASRPAAALSQNEINFTPSPDEVARKAYFAYENQGSQPGHDVQHWLKAEADLIADRNRTRVHGFHNRT
jgi:hypothetical protein